MVKSTFSCVAGHTTGPFDENFHCGKSCQSASCVIEANGNQTVAITYTRDKYGVIQYLNKITILLQGDEVSGIIRVEREERPSALPESPESGDFGQQVFRNQPGAGFLFHHGAAIEDWWQGCQQAGQGDGQDAQSNHGLDQAETKDAG
ncbi:MAG: hypothetical protein LBH01_07970 [Verrucomicrobiales bacterium]|jgi:hypothetical protein|nr:hypothetical protein [Verrucomicrobiales bacterium]